MAILANFPFKLVVGTAYLAGATDVDYGVQVEAVDSTCAGTVPYAATVGGLASLVVDLTGYHDFSTLLTDSSAERLRNLAGTIQHITLSPDGDIDGSKAIFTTALLTSLKTFEAKVGELPNLHVVGQARGIPVVEGFLSSNSLTDRTATFTGAIAQLGAVSATQRVYANVHLIDTTGSGGGISVTPRIESDNAVGFGTPATVVTGSAMTAIGAQQISAPGPITDDYFRIQVAISGTTPHHKLFVAVGVAG